MLNRVRSCGRAFTSSSELQPEFMSEPADNVPTEGPTAEQRCTHCDSVLPAGSERCLMCGAPVLPPADSEDAVARTSDATAESAAEGAEKSPAEIGAGPSAVREEPGEESVASASASPAKAFGAKAFGTKDRRSLAVPVLTGIVFITTAIFGLLIVRYGGPVELALVPTATHIPSTPTFTPTVTLFPTETPQATLTPSVTPMPAPTETPQPPRTHEVDSGETLFGLALFYNVSMESIAALNDFSMETPIQSGQTLQVPWPTATPELEPIAIDINGETVIADPRECERYEIQEGDAISVIAARYNVNFELLQQVNRLNDQSIIQPGDTICIPEINYGGILPPTPGPSPTASPTSFPSGPYLLYPTHGTVVESVEQSVVLQWVAVKDLAPEEWYMVELTNLSEIGEHPRRGFTRENSFRVPHSWRPHEEVHHDFQWRVSIVRVTGRRDDGGFIYTFGGRSSEEGFFTWLGAIPTPTPTPTFTPTPTPVSGS